MSLIESRDILKKLCSNDYYRGDDVQCAIQCLAEGKTINRVRTLEDVGKTVIDETLKDELMKAKDGKGAFDEVNPKWLSLLLTFLSTDPPRREITVRAESGGKSVNITYDPHDADSARAAEVWRKALFSGFAQFKAVEPVAVKAGDVASFGDDCRGQRGDMSPPAQKDTDDNPWTNPETTEKIARLYEFNAAVLPLKAYFAKHGSPRTRIIVTENGAEETEVVLGAPWDGGD